MWSANKVAKIVKMDFDASKLLEQPSLAAKYQLPDDGTGDVKVREQHCGTNVEIKHLFLC